MSSGRLEAFTDGVIAILITIMVLELKVPHGTDWASLGGTVPVLLTYVLSFVYLGIYWSNHHHMLHMTDRVSGGVLWANLHLLFWLSLVPFATSWMGENHYAPVPTALYGAILLLCGFAYFILEKTIIAVQGAGSRLAEAVGSDTKSIFSVALYASAIPLAFLNQTIAHGIYVLVALMWLVPDRRIESRLRRQD